MMNDLEFLHKHGHQLARQTDSRQAHCRSVKSNLTSRPASEVLLSSYMDRPLPTIYSRHTPSAGQAHRSTVPASYDMALTTPNYSMMKKSRPLAWRRFEASIRQAEDREADDDPGTTETCDRGAIGLAWPRPKDPGDGSWFWLMHRLFIIWDRRFRRDTPWAGCTCYWSTYADRGCNYLLNRPVFCLYCTYL